MVTGSQSKRTTTVSSRYLIRQTQYAGWLVSVSPIGFQIRCRTSGWNQTPADRWLVTHADERCRHKSKWRRNTDCSDQRTSYTGDKKLLHSVRSLTDTQVIVDNDDLQGRARDAPTFDEFSRQQAPDHSCQQSVAQIGNSELGAE